MRTRLKRFSEDFTQSLKPLLSPLGTVLDGLGDPAFENSVSESLPLLRDVQHQFEQLVEKVENNHAFVLIFGPLKSGKSTLMNALAGAYVSEVSALPAYPCLVYVGDGKKNSFEVTRYNGRSQKVRDTGALQRMVDHDHVRLASALREVEERGEEFDPAQHLPEAIRCIDVRLPATGLAESGSILVDTPGLYSRMRFGYDRMTRDFRNSAACAVFVVKTDNLFLEQVFDEFSELLDLFSRIFLVVNIDATKRDLSEQGELIPSLEQREPQRVVTAFEEFSMSAPLKAAAAEGRLQIYPIDLMRAAQRRLRNGDGQATGGDEPPSPVDARFDDFQDDLTEFLNSAEYLTAFMTDSIHRGDTLLRDLRTVLEDKPEVPALRSNLAEIEASFAKAKKKHDAVQRLLKSEWHGSFDQLGAQLSEGVRSKAEKASIKILAALEGALSRWFDADSSLAELNERQLAPLLQEHREDLVRFSREAIGEQLPQPFCGLELDHEIAHDVATLELEMMPLGEKALEAASGALDWKRPGQLFAPEDIPVRKRFLDWIFFRSIAKIRKKLFGTPQPERIITRAEKQGRLGAGALDSMKKSLDKKARTHLQEVQGSIERTLVQRYAELLKNRVAEELSTQSDALVEERNRWEKLAESHRKVLALFDQLARSANSAKETLHGLRKEYLADGVELTPEAKREEATTEAQLSEGSTPKTGASTES